MFGKKWKVESFKWKAKKIFESEKRKAKVEKIIEKLKAKSKIFNFEKCKWKAKAEVLWFHFPTLVTMWSVCEEGNICWLCYQGMLD